MLACAQTGLPPVSIDVLEGRVELASESGVERRDGGGRELVRDGPAYFEAGATARVRLRWRSCASLELAGPAAFEWRESHGPSGGLYLDVKRIERADVEVRRGPLRLELPGGWLVHLARGAAHLQRRPDGSYDVEHVAGAPLLVGYEPASGQVRPPQTVLPGATIHLAAERVAGTLPADSPGETKHAPWTGSSWPWPEAPAARLEEPRLAAWGPRWRGQR
jgi:hypothetical protein